MARITGAAISAACLSMIGTAGFADVTAQDVWTNVQGVYRDMGFEVSTASVTPNDKGLVVEGVTLSREGAAAGPVTADSSFTVPKIEFIEMGDGRVRVDVADKIDGASKTTGEDGEELVSATTGLVLKGDEIIASGEPENVRYQISLDDLQVVMNQTVHQAEADFPTDLDIGLSGVKGDYTIDQRDGSKQEGSYQIEQATLNGKGSDPAGGSFTVTGAASDISTDVAQVVPAGVKLDAGPVSYGAEGLESRMNSTIGPIDLKFETQAEDGDAKIHLSSTRGAQNIEMKDGQVSYQANGDAVKVDVMAPNLPIELTFSLAEFGSGLSFPMTAGDDPKPFGLNLGLKGLELSDQLWAMVDPQGKLPRDPAHLDLKLSGHAKVNQDLFAQDFGMLPGAPGEMRDLTLDNLHLDAVGVDLTGHGAVTFDSSAGIPWPVGKVQLALSGAKGLMDNLTEMGLMPQDQAMFAQMILGLYAKPTGDDAMETEIEFTQDGHILANGQTIQ